MATQTERREATRAALLDAAAACLVEQGVAGFTTADIARRAGLSNGALFRHFPTKGDLLAATVEAVFTRLRHDYEASFDALAPEQRTIEVLLEMLWGAMSDPTLAAVYEVYTGARTDARMQAAIEPVVRDHMDRLHSLGHDLIAQVPGIDPSFISHALDLSILAMQGLVLNLMAKPDPSSPAELVESLTLLSSALFTTEPV